MISESFIVKVVAAPAVLLAGWEGLQRGAEAVVLLAATVGALLYLWTKVIRPFRHFTRRIGRGIDLLEELPHFRREVTKRLDDLDQRVHIIAEADKHRIKDALAGDPRSPVDRRAA